MTPPAVKRRAPRYEYELDFGGHGSMSVKPMTWPTLRRYLIEALREEMSPPSSVTLKVTRA